MRTWLSSVLLFVTGAFAVASGCGNPEVVTNDDLFVPDGSVGGTTSSTGGSFNLGNGGSSDGCPATCEELSANCGFVTDTKCGGVIQCGTCKAGEVCGGTEPNRCGAPTTTLPDGGACTPSTCDELQASCGNVSDPKCPGTVVDCGQDVCPGHCTNGTCTTTVCKVDPATTCEGLGYVCGQAVDNCGNVLDCGTKPCAAGNTCIQGVCTPPPACVVDPKTTCAGRGWTCGQAADNCGHPLTCGPAACAIPNQTCGGGVDAGGNPILGVCGCTGTCKQTPTCAPGVTTTLTGKVYDPAGRNPLYHVLVYVANNPSDPNLKTFPPGITCDVCGASAAGSPLISTPGATDPPAGEYSGVDGSFTLKNVPAGNVTLVIQLGRWRRTFPINVANPCAPNTIVDKTLLMPSTKAQGNIPLMAMVTGNADSLECVLRKMGIDKSEFTNPAQGGRVQFYTGTGNAGQTINAQTPTQDTLFAAAGGQPVINGYDMTILSCQGAEYTETAPNQTTLRNYADAGGRVFSTHYSYSWLRNNDVTPGAPVGTVDNWSEVAKWHVDENDRAATAVGVIDKLSNPKGVAFQGWLEAVGASAVGSGTTNVIVIRHDTDLISAVPKQTQQWLYRAGDDARMCSRTGNACPGGTGCTPNVCSVRTQQACTTNLDCNANVCQGRTQTACATNADCMIGGNNRGPCVPNTCQPNTCTAGFNYTGQETPLHFTFNAPVNLKENLTVKPPIVQCGRVLFSDFHVFDANENGETFPTECGKLPPGLTRATPNAAGNGVCATDAECTGTCAAGKCPWGTACTTAAQCASTCSGGVCLDPMNPQEKLLEFMIFDLGSCVPTQTCTKKPCPAGQCGLAPDGCGGLATCAPCPTGEACGVGQPPVANQCGKVTCTPTGCPKDQECGFVSDGCSGVANCGPCPAGQTCNNGKCGSTACDPKTCMDQGIECGQAGDECGKLLTCPACPAKESCIDGKCVPLTCPPKTCADQGLECGQAADGCGNKIASCGDCPAGDLCIANQCVHVN